MKRLVSWLLARAAVLLAAIVRATSYGIVDCDGLPLPEWFPDRF